MYIDFALVTNTRQRERAKKKWKRILLEGTEVTTNKYAVFMEKITR
jgi:hypothetical protein